MLVFVVAVTNADGFYDPASAEQAFAVTSDDTEVSPLDTSDLLRFHRAPQHYHGHGGSVLHKLNPIHQDMYSIVFYC